MANQPFSSPDQPGVHDRKTLVANQAQPVAVANTGRTYAAIFLRSRAAGVQLDVSFGQALNGGPGCIPLSTDEGGLRAIDSSTVPELTTAAISVCGNQAGIEFTFLEVAAVQSAQQ